MWTIISTFRPEATKKIIDDARKNRSIKSEENKEDLIEVDNEIFQEIKTLFSQKVNKPIVNILSIAHSGRAPFLLKKSAKLKKIKSSTKDIYLQQSVV